MKVANGSLDTQARSGTETDSTRAIERARLFIEIDLRNYELRECLSVCIMIAFIYSWAFHFVANTVELHDAKLNRK